MQVKNIIIGIIGLAISAEMIIGCGDFRNTNEKVSDNQKEMLKGVEGIGLPDIQNFMAYRLRKTIYELEDRKVLTYTYVKAENTNELVHVCDSVGYGQPYATQMSSPQDQYGHPQAEPNGLFPPASADGTYVQCVNPNNPKQTGILYIEPKIIVSPWKLKSSGEYIQQ
jgi:hypothetical protein